MVDPLIPRFLWAQVGTGNGNLAHQRVTCRNRMNGREISDSTNEYRHESTFLARNAPLAQW